MMQRIKKNIKNGFHSSSSGTNRVLLQHFFFPLLHFFFSLQVTFVQETSSKPCDIVPCEVA